jgi:hypothetical protein
MSLNRAAVISNQSMDQHRFDTLEGKTTCELGAKSEVSTNSDSLA